MSLKVKMSQVSDNPFYGKLELKSLLNNGKSVMSRTQMNFMLDNAWNECKNSLELRQAFFIVCFSIGDITNREHNIFNKEEVDNGGNAARPQMMWILSWIRRNHPTQYYKLMFGRIINEFISWFAILSQQVRTTKGGKSIVDIDTYQSLKEHDLVKVAEYIAERIKFGTEIEKVMLAKWLVRPQTSKRQKINKDREKIGSRNLQSETIKSNKVKIELYKHLSELMNWEVIYHPHNIQFKGLNEFKKKYNTNFESVLFSQKEIQNIDKEQFFKFLNELPSCARYRVQRRLIDKDGTSKGKWFNTATNSDLSVWFKEWEKFKENKQQEQRDLTEKIRQGTATKEDIVKLEKVKKEAKVTTGASDLLDELDSLMKGTADNKLIQSLMDKIKFEVPVLTVADCSGSMLGLPIYIARLLTTLTMLKNPSNELDNILIKFGTHCEIITDYSKGEIKPNRFMIGKSTVVEKLIDRTKSFSWNFNNIGKFINSNMGGTNFSSVANKLSKWIEEDSSLKQNRIEQLQSYPVILVISDGDMNSDYSAEASMMQFMNKMRQYGWNGVVVVWDIKMEVGNYQDKFTNVPNCIHYYGYNLGIINQIFTNIHDLDVIDIYQELKSLHASNRYTPVKKLVI